MGNVIFEYVQLQFKEKPKALTLETNLADDQLDYEDEVPSDMETEESFMVTKMNFWNLIHKAGKRHSHWQITWWLCRHGGLNDPRFRRASGSSVSGGWCWGWEHHWHNAGSG